MCDAHGFLRKPHWKGWSWTPATPPIAAAAAATGPWLDLTWPFSADAPRLPHFDPPRITRVRAISAGDHGNLSTLETLTHIGTHIDAPVHFVDDAPAFQDIPVSRLTGTGVVWPIEVEEYGEIGPELLEAARPRLRPGDFLVLDANWSRRFGDPSYFRHPWLNEAASHWLLRQNIGLLGVDWANPDAPAERRGDDFLWPVHRALLAHGVLIAEHLTNVAPLAGRRAEFVFGAINIVDGDGAPARVLARALEGGDGAQMPPGAAA